MFENWTEFDRTFALMDDLRRRMARTFEEEALGYGTERDTFSATWPRTAIYDSDNELVLKAELPGVGEKDFNLSIHEDVLTLSGERKTRVPEGYAAHRQERGAMRFSRSFTLPQRVDVEKTTALIKNGILTVTLPKHPEAKPRQITVRAG